MLQTAPSRLKAILIGLLVTFLWSTSWVLIKIGLKQHIGPMTFAGLRYTLAFLCLLPFTLRKGERQAIAGMSRRNWLLLAGLGVVYYTLAQGTQYIGLAYLPSVTVNLLLNLNAVLVVFMAMFWLNENMTTTQWMGFALNIIGILVFFLPLRIAGGEWIGYAATGVCVLTNALGSVFSRSINRARPLSPLGVTAVSMGVGGPLMLLAGLVSEGLPALDWTGWLIILWLAVVNTAVAFTLWNFTLQTLTAVESTIIASVMLAMVAVEVWVFLGESLDWKKIIGLLLTMVGVVLVQLHRSSAP
jgi:drug/metabolite transporter (DMT)-like permease